MLVLNKKKSGFGPKNTATNKFFGPFSFPLPLRSQQTKSFRFGPNLGLEAKGLN